jgi:hypothetical protein
MDILYEYNIHFLKMTIKNDYKKKYILIEQT